MALVSAGFDLLVALTCVGAALWLLRQPESRLRGAALAMVLMAVASALGALRYGGVEGLVGLHRGASRVAGSIAPASFALVAAALTVDWAQRKLELGLLGLIVAGVGVGLVLDVGLYPTLVGALAVLVLVGLAIRSRTMPAITTAAGALLLALAGLVIGSQGTLGPFNRVDLFHLTLAVAHALIAHGLVKQS